MGYENSYEAMELMEKWMTKIAKLESELKQLQEFAKAKAEGRLVILEAKVQDYHTYNRKMFHIYQKKISDFWRIATFNTWQKINRIFLKTYPLIEECARCEDCGRNVHDFYVPDSIWIKVYGNELGTLCYDCFCNRADEMGLKIRMNLKENWQ